MTRLSAIFDALTIVGVRPVLGIYKNEIAIETEKTRFCEQYEKATDDRIWSILHRWPIHQLEGLRIHHYEGKVIGMWNRRKIISSDYIELLCKCIIHRERSEKQN